MIDWNDYPNFTEKEFLCQCGCGRADMDQDFIDRLQAMRSSVGFALRVTSGFRCPDHNERVSSSGRTGAHTTGKAADIHVWGEDAHTVLKQAMTLFTGVGVAQKGATQSRFIHVDSIKPGQDKPRPTVWSY